MRHFDVAHHQPHPPGYPLFIAAANAMHAVVPSEPRALGAVSVAGAAIGVVALFALFWHLLDASGAVAATLIAATTPLYWFTAARPLSDSLGVAAAIGVQALILSARSKQALIVAAFCAGAAIGIRTQVLWLTLPLLVFVAAAPGSAAPVSSAPGTRAPITHHPTPITLAFAWGAAMWFVPLVFLSGGPAAYWHALFDQGAEDLSGIQMLWTSPRPRTLLDALYYAFVAPWGWWLPAVVMLSLASAGMLVLVRRNRSTLTTLAIAFVPYLLFDILFQETFTVRYALPLVPPVAALAAAAIGALPQAAAIGVFLPVVMYGAHVGGRSIAAYSREEAPVFRLLADMRATNGVAKPVLAPDRRASFDLRRPLAWLGPDAPAFDRQLTAPPQHEWIEAVKYWTVGGRSPVWFVVDPKRTSIDLVQHGEPVRYRQQLPYPVLMSGTRPSEVDWFRVDRPDWFVNGGWALTPEAAGVSRVDGVGLSKGSIDGRVRALSLSGATVVFGGRNFDPRVRPTLTLAFGGIWQRTYVVDAGPFLHVERLPMFTVDANDGDLVPLSVTADPPSEVAIEQFDLAPPMRAAGGFGRGWYEHELNGETGSQWRWLSDSAEFVYTSTAPAVLRISGESPLKYYSRPSRLLIKAGQRTLMDLQLSDDFTIEVPIPPSVEPSAITIETDQTHVPAERRTWRRVTDRRHLGLRIYSCAVVLGARAFSPGTAGNSQPGR